MQVATIPIQIAVLAPQLSPFMPRTCVIPLVAIAPQFPSVMRDLRLVATDVASIPPAIFGKHRSRTQSDQQ
jgi:hypothetical protein